MATQIQIRRDTAGNWYGNNTVLSVGELAYETDTKRIKIGDGSSFYNNLHYVHDPTAPTQERIDNPIYLHKIEADDNKVQVNDAGSNANVSVEIDGSAELNISADGISLFQGEKVNAILDEDDMTTNSSTALATQQSIKTYVDSLPGTTNIGQLLDVTTSGATSGQVLKYNGASWLPMDDTDTTLILSGESIGSMGDVSLTTPPIADGQILKWNASLTRFEPAAEFFLGLIDDDTFTSGVSAQSVASSESIKAYVDTQVLANIPDSDLIDDDTMGTATATSISSSESIKAYVDNTVGGLTLGATTLGALTDVDVTGAATNKILKYNGSNWIVADDTDTTLTLLDEDDFSSDSDTQAPTQQSVKAYVDANSSTLTLLDEDDFASDSATAVPSQQSTKAYISSQLGSGYTAPPAGQSAFVGGWKFVTTGDSPYTAVPGERLFVESDAGPVDIDIPGTAGGHPPVIGHEVMIVHTVGGNPVTIWPDGTDNHPIDGANPASITPIGVGATIWLVYKGPLDGWVSIGHDGTAYPYA